MGVAGLLVLYSIIKGVTMIAGAAKSEDHTVPEVKFPAPKRDWAAEREEFVQAFLAAEEKKGHH
jgi:hypothetical protein